jgi:hypothetical protein
MHVTLQFVRGRGLASRLIAWFGGGPRFSHVDVVLPDGTLLGSRSDRVAGVPSGVQIRPASYTTGEAALQVQLPCTPSHAKAFYEFLHAQLGKPYDHMSILGFIVGRNWREDDTWFCSELASAALEHAGLLRQLAARASKITPGDLLLVLSALVPVKL